MVAIIHSLLTLLAFLTRQELAQHVTYLEAKNRILRSELPDRITLSNQERWTLVRHGKKLGARIKELISIVSYSTFHKRVRSVQDAPDKRPKAQDGKSGRPRFEESLSDLIIRIRYAIVFRSETSIQTKFTSEKPWRGFYAARRFSR